MFQRALISVTDKTGLMDFLNKIKIKEIVSTSGTAKFLKNNGIHCNEVSEVTGFPEVLDGRVKTLHPKIHMALLARLDRSCDVDDLNTFDVQAFDLVIVNLYDFINQNNIENIDIGGVAILRAAAKNYQWITVLSDSQDYESLTNFLQNSPDLQSKINYNKQLAEKCFLRTANYDLQVSKYLSDQVSPRFDSMIWNLKSVQEFKYGENPQQKAFRYKIADCSNNDLFIKVFGPEISFNNFLDIKSGLELLADLDCGFTGENISVGIKHNNPCGVSVASEVEKSLQQMLQSDPKSIFGGVLICNYVITEIIAKNLSQIFLEVIVAFDFTAEALEILSTKKKLKILKVTKDQLSRISQITRNGFVWGEHVLVQDKNSQVSRPSDWQYVGRELSFVEIKDILFAETIGKHLKSNAIAIVKNQTTLGLGMGQVNRSDAVKQAVTRMLDFHPTIEGATLFSDAFFPFKDSIELLPKNKIATVVQPGGSLRDLEVESECLSRGLNHVKTQLRHFKH